MKRLFTILAVVFLTLNVYGQAPEKMSYQSVIRDADDNLVTNQNVGMQISILQGTEAGTSVYIETHITSTNVNGLVTIEIGSGTPVTGTFEGIDWSTGTYFLKTETDPEGETNYSISGTSQLLSVPYALHSKTTETVDYNSLLNKPTLFDSHYSSLTGTPSLSTVATSGSYDDLLNLPTLFTGSYSDLSNKPNISDSISSQAVLLEGNQTIAGDKNFTGKLTGTINANNSIIADVASPESQTDAVNKAYVDASVAFSVSKTGDTLFLGNNRFVIIPNLSTNNSGIGILFDTPDISWTQVNAGTSTNFTGKAYVAFGNNTFVAVTDNNCASLNNAAYVSTDFGLSWTQKTTPGSTDISGVAFSPDNNYFVISHRCYESSRNYSYSEDNGDTWTPLTHSPSTYRYELFRIKDYFFSNLYQNCADRSPDGVTWTQLTFNGSNTTSVTTYSEKFGFYYASGGTNFWTSPDATDWTMRDTLGNYRFIAGNDVLVAYTISNNAPVIKQSTDGLTFEKINNLLDITFIYRIKFINDLFWANISVEGDDTKKLMVSKDGINWKFIITPELAGNANDLEIGYDPVLDKTIIIIPCVGGMFLRGEYDPN